MHFVWVWSLLLCCVVECADQDEGRKDASDQEDYDDDVEEDEDHEDADDQDADDVDVEEDEEHVDQGDHDDGEDGNEAVHEDHD